MPYRVLKPFWFVLLVLLPLSLYAQRRKDKAASPPSPATAQVGASLPAGPKSFEQVFGTPGGSAKGLFTVHQVEEKWYFELADSIFGRDMLVVSRFSKASHPGNLIENKQELIRWERGPSHRVFLRKVAITSLADDASMIYRAVRNTTLAPIEVAFEVKSLGKYSDKSLVIEVTDFLKGDNKLLLPSELGSLQSDRSYIETITTFPINTEVKTVKTFSGASSTVTVEVHNSFLLLPTKPMHPRRYDPRVGYLSSEYVVYTDQQQQAEKQKFIQRWRLEPQAEDWEKWQRGELVEPRNPIVYYIDPAIPKKWRPYLIQGVKDWNVAFEQAGFKNAITAREWPENDSTMNLQDARFSVIRYSTTANHSAIGTHLHDPRSGEILAGEVSWSHPMITQLRNWYFVAAAAVDPQARTMTFPDSLMGKLIRFVSSHEVGHTLGLENNTGASHATPVEKLRDKAWLAQYGHTVSMMDNARFNYVAQPEDSIPQQLLFPRIGIYDKWAIEWGYKPLPDSLEEDEQQKVRYTWIKTHQNDPKYWYGNPEVNTDDPRSQAEALGDNTMKASEYGIKNLKRVMAHLPEWTREEGDPYTNLSKMYEK